VKKPVGPDNRLFDEKFGHLVERRKPMAGEPREPFSPEFRGRDEILEELREGRDDLAETFGEFCAEVKLEKTVKKGLALGIAAYCVLAFLGLCGTIITVAGICYTIKWIFGL
jgi:hypothetical protein